MTSQTWVQISGQSSRLHSLFVLSLFYSEDEGSRIWDLFACFDGETAANLTPVLSWLLFSCGFFKMCYPAGEIAPLSLVSTVSLMSNLWQRSLFVFFNCAQFRLVPPTGRGKNNNIQTAYLLLISCLFKYEQPSSSFWADWFVDQLRGWGREGRHWHEVMIDLMELIWH